MIQLDVVGIRLADDSPVLLLQEDGGTRLLPIWVSSMDAAAIALVLEDVAEFHRPMTHDLLAAVLEEMDTCDSGGLEITEVHDGVFHATLSVGDHSFDCRPSDGIAVALRLGWTISCPERLMDQVGVPLEETDDDEVDRFREFLDTVSADDFETGD